MDWQKATDQVLTIAADTFGRGRVITYVPAIGAPYGLARGIFANAHVAVDIGSGVDNSMLAPTLGVRLSDLATKPRKGDRVTVDGVTYKIIDSQEDGEGGSTLILQKA